MARKMAGDGKLSITRLLATHGTSEALPVGIKPMLEAKVMHPLLSRREGLSTKAAVQMVANPGTKVQI